MKNQTHTVSRFVLGALYAGALMIVPFAAARADDAPHDGWRTTFLEENDSLYFNSDKHYTQGLRISLLSPTLENSWTDWVYNLVGKVPSVFEQGGTRRLSILAGQNIYTPKNIDIKPSDPSDRPYAGWLYGGLSLLQETNGTSLENLEFDLGVVGPGALGRQVQNDFHQFIGVHHAQGWGNQIQHEVGGVLAYERMWHVSLLGDTNNGAFGLDAVPQVGATVGNVYDYGEVGGMIRLGKHLEADYGPVRIRPSLSGTDYFNAAKMDHDWGYYVFVGAQGRAVGHNIFLDGNSFRRSPSVASQPLVADLQAGVSVFTAERVRFDFSAVRRTREFVGQKHPDVIGTAAFAFTW
jgi:hypothetical protein